MLESIQDKLKQIFYLDLRMLACFRMGLGCILLWDLWSRLDAFQAHYGLTGVLPPEKASLFAEFFAILPVYSLAIGDTYTWGLFIINGLAAVCLLLGIKTRWMTILCWLLLNSLHARNPVILYGADRELAALLFWSMFLPLGAKWSLDMKQRCTWQGTTRIEGWASAGFILQIAIIYFTSAWSKTGDSWSEGNAVWLALNIDAYTNNLGRHLLDFSRLLKGLTYGTLAIEWSAPLLLLCGNLAQLRRVGCWLLIGMQVGFLSFMQLGLFPLVSILGLIAILPRKEVISHKSTFQNQRVMDRRLDYLAAFFVIMMLFWQTMLIRHHFSSNKVLAKMPDSLQYILKTTRLAQSWSMFSPAPPDTDGWFILEYRKENEETSVNLLNNHSPVEWGKPKSEEHLLNSDRWKEWFYKVYQRGLNWESTVRFLANDYLASTQDHDTTGRLRLWFLEESAHQPNRPPFRHLLYESKLEHETLTR